MTAKGSERMKKFEENFTRDVAAGEIVRGWVPENVKCDIIVPEVASTGYQCPPK